MKLSSTPRGRDMGNILAGRPGQAQKPGVPGQLMHPAISHHQYYLCL